MSKDGGKAPLRVPFGAVRRDCRLSVVGGKAPLAAMGDEGRLAIADTDLRCTNLAKPTKKNSPALLLLSTRGSTGPLCCLKPGYSSYFTTDTALIYISVVK